MVLNPLHYNKPILGLAMDASKFTILRILEDTGSSYIIYPGSLSNHIVFGTPLVHKKMGFIVYLKHLNIRTIAHATDAYYFKQRIIILL